MGIFDRFKRRNTKRKISAQSAQPATEAVTKPGASTTAVQNVEAPTESCGLFTICDPNGSANVDVIAIHGLNGHYQKTWTDGGFNWLRDCLPPYVARARIMSFGYDSRVAFSTSVGNIDRFADQLLSYIARERRTEAQRCRPMVFVAHSLGGLVLKLVCSL